MKLFRCTNPHVWNAAAWTWNGLSLAIKLSCMYCFLKWLDTGLYLPQDHLCVLCKDVGHAWLILAGGKKTKNWFKKYKLERNNSCQHTALGLVIEVCWSVVLAGAYSGICCPAGRLLVTMGRCGCALRCSGTSSRAAAATAHRSRQR